MIITELTAQECPTWDAYVESHVAGLPLHLSGWRDVLTGIGGYETPYLLACEAGRPVGVLPLFVVRSFLVGDSLTTPPGGLCADSEAAAAALIERGLEVARRAGVKRFVVQDTRQTWPGSLQTVSHHVYWLVDLRAGVESLWQELDGNIRRQVRLARRNALSVEIDRTGRQLAAFYDVFSRFTHKVGTPVFSRDFLEYIIEAFPARFNIAVVYRAGQPLAAYFQLEMGRTTYGMWGAALPEYLPLRPVYLAYWEILHDAGNRGFHFLDMGRSPTGSNASTYKGQWGGVCRPVYQQVSILKGKGRPADDITQRLQSDGKIQWLRQLWPRLPLPLTCYLGPKLRRHVPFA
jgi:FemAB-related protein (PEP-CTERM system-associated)